MKNLLLSISLSLLCAVAFSQPNMQLLSKEHDFGVFKEEAGRQTFNFIVTLIVPSFKVGDNFMFIVGQKIDFIIPLIVFILISRKKTGPPFM